MQKKCESCGSMLIPSSAFCWQCGTKVSNSSGQQFVKPKGQEPFAQQAPPIFRANASGQAQEQPVGEKVHTGESNSDATVGAEQNSTHSSGSQHFNAHNRGQAAWNNRTSYNSYRDFVASQNQGAGYAGNVNYPNFTPNQEQPMSIAWQKVFCIINMVMGVVNVVGLALGIVALIFTLKAKKIEAVEKRNAKLKKVFIINFVTLGVNIILWFVIAIPITLWLINIFATRHLYF